MLKTPCNTFSCLFFSKSEIVSERCQQAHPALREVLGQTLLLYAHKITGKLAQMIFLSFRVFAFFAHSNDVIRAMWRQLASFLSVAATNVFDSHLKKSQQKQSRNWKVCLLRRTNHAEPRSVLAVTKFRGASRHERKIEKLYWKRCTVPLTAVGSVQLCMWSS